MGIPVIRTRFWHRPMILPSLTMPAPNGPPHPFSAAWMASRVASWANCFLYSSLSISVVLMCLFSFYGVDGFCGFVLEGNGGGFVVFSKKGEQTNSWRASSYHTNFQKIATDNA